MIALVGLVALALAGAGRAFDHFVTGEAGVGFVVMIVALVVAVVAIPLALVVSAAGVLS